MSQNTSVTSQFEIFTQAGVEIRRIEKDFRRLPPLSVRRVPEKFSLDFCPAMAHCLVRAMRL
jgi:hypothetical protein